MLIIFHPFPCTRDHKLKLANVFGYLVSIITAQLIITHTGETSSAFAPFISP
jgi:hypothetical protein